MNTIKTLLKNGIGERHYYLFLFLLVLIPNLIVLLFIVWPGFLHADQVYSSMRFLLGRPDEWHSILFTFITIPFFANAQGIGLYGILYNIVFALCVSWSACKLRTLNILNSLKASILYAAVFALSPCFLFHTNVLYSSESVYMIALVPFTIFIIEVVKSKGSWLEKPANLVKLVVVLFVLFELRKNAVLMVVCFIVVMFFCYRKYWKQVATFSAALLVVILVTTGVIKAFDVTPSPSQELVSIPAQQIARVYIDEGYIPPDIQERLEQIRTPEEWKKNYSPSLADDAKRGLNPNLQFVADWLVLGFHNPGIYTNAYLDLTRSFWLWGDTPDYSEYMNVDIFRNATSWTPEIISEVFGEDVELESIFYENISKRGALRDAAVFGWDYLMFKRPIPLVTDILKGLFFNIALPFYLCLAVIAVACWKKQKSLLIISLPLWANMLSLLLFAPMAYFRYSAMMYMIIPLLIVVIVRLVRNASTQPQPQPQLQPEARLQHQLQIQHQHLPQPEAHQ